MLQISIVIPVFNEQDSLQELHQWITTVLEKHTFLYEIIFIDDGSRDDSWQAIELIANKDKRVRAIQFKRNQGKSPCLHTAFQSAKGQVVVTMDADLQDSPEEIPELYNLIANSNYDLVSGWKKKEI